ncbi:MAG: hypothetical protein HY738_14215 [Bacteroidia bacterium]|nr:hypothetical protein [Bacteroidia bacterium]
MKKYITYIPLIFYSTFIILLFSVCNNDKNEYKDTIIFGTVKNAKTDTPIMNAKVSITGWYDMFGTDTLCSTYTDENGHYELKILIRGYCYEISSCHHSLVATSNYYKNRSVIISGIGKINNIVIKLLPAAYLKLKVKNKQPYNEDDYIKISPEAPVGSCNSFSYPISYMGDHIDTTFCCFYVCGDSAIAVNWCVKKNNSWNEFNDNVFCPAFDTTTFTINY